MDLYIILGQNSQPLFPYLLTEAEAKKRILESGINAGLYRIEVPWVSPSQINKGGKGKNAYPLGMELTTMRVPTEIRRKVKAYAEWLAQQENG